MSQAKEKSKVRTTEHRFSVGAVKRRQKEMRDSARQARQIRTDKKNELTRLLGVVHAARAKRGRKE